jgi:hypothetical protein
MDFLKVRVGSFVVKNIHDFLKNLSKIEQYSTFEGKKTNSIWSCRKKELYIALIVFFISRQCGQENLY